jgi:two-component system, sensor histidine kinase and response regulator
LKRGVVLVIDDDPMVCDIIEGFLYQDEYEMTFAHSGSEALEIIDSTQPDIILLDVLMPEMDGFEVCRRLKSNEKWRDIPVIIVTGLHEKTDVLRGFEVGANDFIHKPFNDIELRSRVRAMLRRKKQQDEARANQHSS